MNGEPDRNPIITDVTGGQVREAMVQSETIRVDHHSCSLCGVMTYYRRIDNQLYFSSACDCVYFNSNSFRVSTWDEAADWINMQSNPKIKAELMKKFGFKNMFILKDML